MFCYLHTETIQVFPGIYLSDNVSDLKKKYVIKKKINVFEEANRINFEYISNLIERWVAHIYK